MALNIMGYPTDSPMVRAGFIGCGSHAFRNIYPTFQFNPVELVAVCDLQAEKAVEYARCFGARHSHTDYREMLKRDEIEAVFIVTNYDGQGRPRYPAIAADCLRAGKHVWMEKPPAADTGELRKLQALARETGRNVMVGLKKMFFPANEKAHELMRDPDFGNISLAMLNYPQHIPSKERLERYVGRKEPSDEVVGFLDHLCHPASLLLYLMGMPLTMFYQRAASGAGVATFAYDDGRMATLTFTHGAAVNGGMERTTILSDTGRHIVIDNNIRVAYHRDPPGRGYGSSPSYYLGAPGEASAVWEPEFSLGQLYNKGLFLLGYWGEVNEFSRSILEKRGVAKAHLEHAWQVTRIFEAFAEGSGKVIRL